MSELTQGLRFDVYERVHLPEEVPAIDELEEIELVPRIQVVQQGEQAILRGQLLLSGVYRTADRSASAQSMEHRIPVEITLPMNRIERLDDISVEIDNFDVDLLSARTLNITGVLSLSGIRVESSSEEEGEWKEEPYTVVHRQEAQPTGDISPVRYLELDEEEDGPQGKAGGEREFDQAAPYRDAEAVAGQSYDPVEEAQNEPYAYAAGWTQLGSASGAREEQENASFQQEESSSRQDAEAENEALADSGESSSPFRAPIPPASEIPQVQREERQSAFSALRNIAGEIIPAEPEAAAVPQEEDPAAVLYGRPAAELPALEEADSEPQRAEAEAAGGGESASAFAAEPFERHEPLQEQEKQELRIAFGSKRSASIEEPGQELASSLIGSSRREREQRQAAERSRQSQESQPAAPAEEVEWQSLFLGRVSEEKPFRKVRICIVQREETLDLIADRYHLQARELALYNRLADQGVAEGQVLYIP
ncbi:MULTISPECIES: LysM peptidoglycan-binding domain-containing protein [unclassified Paenibacillus]|uniref:LysM peptidoglycan-binding domain-containing protein n=1 Tax=unclassified Paenibacillus TaxID=185978 RepID=UPI0009546F1D|nr:MULTISPECIES: LysM peptidoglycan-binding domain-containing protein [unclassified Paenibacillus]ASS66339.2 LysM peptidoglycan-binding domain-containing protein [Paenibacillus sp. RUD330]SIQ07349.1 stage VI sporulation protein D [Paenibacillus sp. RU4X]SIQ27413.1 stage VI sporulation protein D [Paenibacillus sp. RU4T]